MDGPLEGGKSGEEYSVQDLCVESINKTLLSASTRPLYGTARRRCPALDYFYAAPHQNELRYSHVHSRSTNFIISRLKWNVETATKRRNDETTKRRNDKKTCRASALPQQINISTFISNFLAGIPNDNCQVTNNYESWNYLKTNTCNYDGHNFEANPNQGGRCRVHISQLRIFQKQISLLPRKSLRLPPITTKRVEVLRSNNQI